MIRLALALALLSTTACTTLTARVDKAVRITASACRGILAEQNVEPEIREACETVIAVESLLPVPR